MSKNGFDNEECLRSALNGNKVTDLNSNLKEFINFLSEDFTKKDTISCEKEAGANKSDLVIRIGSKGPFRVSVKKGQANSVHQEPIEDFISYIKSEFGADEELCNDFKQFIWGNGTLNGTGKKEDREGVPQLKKSMSRGIERMRCFLEKHKRALVTRFLIEGLKSTKRPDAVYYGTPNDGLWAWFDKAIDFLCDKENESKSVLPVGGLTFQAWNRAIKEGSVSDKKRGDVQSKWTAVEKHLRKIMNEKDE